MLQIVFDNQERNLLKTFVSPESIIGIPIPLDIGTINCAPTSKIRKSLLAEMMGFHSKESTEVIESDVDNVWNRFVLEYQKLKEKAEEGISVRIWYSSAAFSLCGFYSVIHELVSKKTQLTAVKLPELIDFWGEVEPEHWSTYLPLEKEITWAEQTLIAERWEMLKKENAPLRASIGGRIYSVKGSFYDYFIWQAIAEPCRVSDLIINVIKRYKFGIGDWLIAKRIEYLIETGGICIVKKEKDFYNYIIKRC